MNHIILLKKKKNIQLKKQKTDSTDSMVSLHQHNSATSNCPRLADGTPSHQDQALPGEVPGLAQGVLHRIASCGAAEPATAVGHGTGHGKHRKNDWKWWFIVDLPMKTHEKWWLSIVFCMFTRMVRTIYMFIICTFLDSWSWNLHDQSLARNPAHCSCVKLTDSW